MKLTNEMLLASNWKKYMILLDREESWDIVKDQVIELHDNYNDHDDKHRLRLAEKVEEILDSIEDGSDQLSCFWSMYELEGLEGGWMLDYVDTQIWDGKQYDVLWQFVEKEDHEVCDYIVDMGEEDAEVYDSYDDIYQKLVNMNVIEYQ